MRYGGRVERKIGLNGVALSAFDTDKDGKQSRFRVGRKMVRVGVGVSSFLVFSEFCFWGSWGRGVCVCGRGALRRLSELRGKLLGWPRGWMSCVLFPFCSFLDGWAFEGFDLRLGTGGIHWWKLTLLVRMSCAHDRAAAHHRFFRLHQAKGFFWPLAVFFFKQDSLWESPHSRSLW